MDTPFKEVNNHSRKMIINVVLTFLFSSVSIVFLTLSCSFDFVFYYSLPLFVSVSILAFCIIFLVSSVSDYNMYLFNEITASISKKYQDAHTEVDDILCIKIEDIVLGLLREQEYRPHSLESAKEYLNTFKHDEFVIKIYDRYEEMKTSKRTFLNYAKAYGKEIKNDRVEKYCFSIKSMCFTLFEGNKKSVEKYTNRSLSIINQILEDEKEAIRLKREKEKAEKEKRELDRLNREIDFMRMLLMSLRKEKEESSPTNITHYSRKNLYLNFCWNCGTNIDSTDCKKCPKCGYYHCRKCGECMCNYPYWQKK